MLDAQIRTGLGYTDYGVKSPGRSDAAQTPASLPSNAAPSGSVASQGIGYATHVVAPDTLVQAQEARSAQNIRRDDGGTQTVNGQELSDEELERVQELKKTDQEVRAHERAHRAAGGTLTGPAQFEYVRGPDGQQYAVNGEVSIDVSRGNSASATAAKMEAVIRAALAPANPSAQDLAVAAQARQILNEVSQEARSERQGLLEGEGSGQVPSKAQQATGAYELVQQQSQDVEDFLDTLSVVA